jgi:hypothetical protein
VRIADALQVPVDSLIERENVPTPSIGKLLIYYNNHGFYEMLNDMPDELKGPADKIKRETFTKFKSTLDSADSYMENDRQRAQELYVKAFLTAKESDMKDFLDEHVETLLNLCHEFSDSESVSSISEKYERAPYRNHKGHLVFFAHKMSELNYIEDAKLLLIAAGNN